MSKILIKPTALTDEQLETKKLPVISRTVINKIYILMRFSVQVETDSFQANYPIRDINMDLNSICNEALTELHRELGY